jgi:hypothetical protein
MQGHGPDLNSTGYGSMLGFYGYGNNANDLDHFVTLSKNQILKIKFTHTPLNPVILCLLLLAGHPVPLDLTLSKGTPHQCSGLNGHPHCSPDVEPVRRKHIFN